VFEHSGINMLGSAERYFDAVSMSSGKLPTGFSSEAAWVAQTLHLPSVTLTSPSNAAVVSGAVSLAADASDPGGAKLGTAGSIAKVEWFKGSECKVAEAQSAPYTATWSAEEGAHEIYARATDADGNTATSSKVTVYVGNRQPTASITSPSVNAIVSVGSQTMVQIAATDPDGSVAKVELFAKKQGAAAATSVGVDTSAAFQVSWTPPEKGAYLLYAVATDAAGKTGTSAYVGVTAGATTSGATLSASNDAAMKGRTSDRDTTNNYGAVEMYMRAPDATDGEQSIVSIFKFDESSFSSQAEVRSAKLRLYVSSLSLGGAMAVFDTTGSTGWAEASVTWNNGPKRNNKISVTSVTSSNNWYEWDVTSVLDAAVKAGSGLSTMTFWVQGETWTGSAVSMNFDSRTRSNSPQLVVTSSDVATPSSTSAITLEAVDDAAVKGRSGDRDQTNNLSCVELYMRAPTASDPNPSVFSLFKFDVSSIASKAEVSSAKLRLYVSETKLSEADIAAYSTTGTTSWAEATVTWNNGPTKKDKIALTRVTDKNNWYEWDVTNYLDSALKAGTSLSSVTFWLEGDTWTGSNVGMTFDSRSKTNKPQLSITTSNVATRPAFQCPAYTMSEQGAGGASVEVPTTTTNATTTTPPPDPKLSGACTFCLGWVAIAALAAAVLAAVGQ